jgi:16S rRNA processing protein RimM
MQYEEELILLGLVLKTHGIDGQMVIRLDLLPEEELENNEPVFIEIDGIPVPFFIRGFRYLTDDGAIIHLDEVNSSEEASAFVNCRVFIHKSVVAAKTGNEYDALEGFRIIDENHGDAGVLLSLEESTENMLIIADFNGREVLIPFHENIIRSIDYDNRIIHISAPEGLLDLYL